MPDPKFKTTIIRIKDTSWALKSTEDNLESLAAEIKDLKTCQTKIKKKKCYNQYGYKQLVIMTTSRK